MICPGTAALPHLQSAAPSSSALSKLLRQNPHEDQRPAARMSTIPVPPIAPPPPHGSARRDSKSYGSSRAGLPVSMVGGDTGECDVLEGLSSGSLARRGLLVFEPAWPHHVITLDGRMAALLQKSCSEAVGRSIGSLFENEEDVDAAMMCASCARKFRDSWFVFQGRLKGNSEGHGTQFVVGLSAHGKGTRGAANTAFLELVALPREGTPERGAVAQFDASQQRGHTPLDHVDAELARRLGDVLDVVQDDKSIELIGDNSAQTEDVGFAGPVAPRTVRAKQAAMV